MDTVKIKRKSKTKEEFFTSIAECLAAIVDTVETNHLESQEFGKIRICDLSALQLYNAYDRIKKEGLMDQ